MTNLRKAYSQREYLVLENMQTRRVDSVNLIFCPERKSVPILAICL